jgi:hypothetical protein
MSTAIAIIVGICLAASCGFRVFAPLLVAGAAARLGYLPVNQSFEWLASWPAIIAFSVAALVEIAAFYIPWLDNLLDTIASPAATIAGMVLFAAVAVDIDPYLRWTLAIIAGGGSAAVVQGGTVLTRLASTGTTGGVTNFIVATFEAAASFVFPALTIVLPVLTFTLLLVLVLSMYFAGRRVLAKLLPQPTPQNRDGI